MIDRYVKLAAIGKTSRRFLFFAIKLSITCACFWYLLRQVNLRGLLRGAEDLDYRWFMAAAITLFVQVPLVASRWSLIANALEPRRPPVPLGAMVAISMISNFFIQVLPNVMGDAIRVWMLSKIRTGWRSSLIGVIIDRGVGVGALLAIGFVTLLFPSPFTAFDGFRKVLLLLFGALLLIAANGVVWARFVTPILTRYRATQWIGEIIMASRSVLIGSPAAISVIALAFAIHFLSITAIWELGKAFAMPLSGVEAATLFTLMVAAALVPISVSGWGVREMMVAALLTAHGMPTQRALLFSISFGLALVAAATPGAIVMVFYSPKSLRQTSSAT